MRLSGNPHGNIYPSPPQVLPAKRSWVARHKVASFVAALFVLGLIGSAMGLQTGTSTPSVAIPATTMAAWSVQNRPRLHALSADLGVMHVTANLQDAGALTQGCRVLLTDVTDFQVYGLPTPDTLLTSDLSQMLYDDQLAASTCIAGDLAASEQHLQAVVLDATIATARINTLS